jgi:hypothetical protein
MTAIIYSHQRSARRKRPYVAKLDELVKKFRGLTGAALDLKQGSLALQRR